MSDRPHVRSRHTQAAVVAVLLTVLAGTLAPCSREDSVKGGAERADAASVRGTDGAAPRTEGGDDHNNVDGRGDEHGAGPAGNRVTLTEAGFETARITVEPARAEAASHVSGGLEVPGQVEFDPARVAIISPRTAGRIERLLVVPGSHVSAGETVALLFSPAFLTAQTDLVQAKRRAELLAGTRDSPGAQALLEAARRRLELLGVSRAGLAQLETSGEPMSLFPVAAPFAGSILETAALAGQAVEPGSPIFRLADLSTVTIAAQVPERSLAALRIGQGAAITVAAYPDRRFAGRVERISDQLDSTSRTVEAFIRVPNPGRVLKPGMFATVVLDAPTALGTAAGPVVTVPSSAVVTDGDARYVFVQIAPFTFERRPVEVTPAAGALRRRGRITVASGLSAGDTVVTQGAFTLKSELAKASFAEDEH